MSTSQHAATGPADEPDHALALVPVTPALAALIHQLQQEQLSAKATPEPGATLIPAMGLLKPVAGLSDACHQVAYADDYTSSVNLQRSYLDYSKWLGVESRRDTQGRHWSRAFTAITDDFGSLVEVAL